MKKISPDWRPGAALDVLRARARILTGIRAFFIERDVLEVETPLLSAAGTTDVHLESFSTRYEGPGAPHGQTLYLHTSPEFPMKRLLAAGSGAIYQLCHVFRQGELGRRHNPEFTLLEWYRPGYDHHALMSEVAELVGPFLSARLVAPPEYLTYRDAFLRHVGLDPHHAPMDELRRAAIGIGISHDFGDDRDSWLDLLLTHAVEPHLGQGRLTFLHAYPATQAALARLAPDESGDPVAERFELYVEGVELANGFHELANGDEQRRRFEADNAARARSHLPVIPMDGRLIAALEAGLPDCAGVALGIDRLVMLAVGATRLEEVLAFPLERA